MRTLLGSLLVVSAGLLCLTPPAASQSSGWHRLYPMHVGDEWRYVSYDSTFYKTMGQLTRYTLRRGILRRTVVAQRDSAGARWYAVRIQQDNEQAVTRHYSYREPDSTIVWDTQVSGPRVIWAQVGTPRPFAPFRSPGYIPCEQLLAKDRHVMGAPLALDLWCGAQGTMFVEQGAFAPSVGMAVQSGMGVGANGSVGTVWSYHLVYAKINGTVVFDRQQAVGTALTESPHAALRLWPNPAHGAATVQTTPFAPVTAYDLLGREALRTPADATGRATLTLAPGLYVVASGAARHTLVVR